MTSPIGNFKLDIALGIAVKGTSLTYNLKQLAKDCISLYNRGGYTDNPTKTDYVSFDNAKLQQWLRDMNGAAFIRTEIGVYTPDFITAINDLASKTSKTQSDEYGTLFNSLDSAKYLYRVTIFLFACNVDGTDYMPGVKESSGYNLGNLHP